MYQVTMQTVLGKQQLFQEIIRFYHKKNNMIKAKLLAEDCH